MPQGRSAGSHAWLEASAVRTASDIILGVILLAAAGAAFFGTSGAPFDRLDRLGPGFFPALVAGLLALVGLVLLARGIFVGTASAERWNLIALATITATIIAATLAAQRWAGPLVLLFGPAEYVALMVFVLAVAIVLVCVSRVRAAGMVLLGLLLGTVGTDISTGTPRFTMGMDQLADGIMLPVVALGLIVLAEGVICLTSPSLLLATHVRRIAGWGNPRVPMIPAMAMRLAAALAIAAAGYYAFEFNRTFWDIGVLVVFSLFGVFCKIFGWNRLVLIQAFACGPLLEEKMRQALLLSKGDPTTFLRQPISGTLLALAAGIIASVTAVSACGYAQTARQRATLKATPGPHG